MLLAERAAHGVTELRALTDALPAYAKTGAELRREQVQLGEALDGARQELGGGVLDAAGATVEAGNLPTVSGDRRLLVQLFTNLLDNAVKFRSDEPPAVRIWADAERGGLEDLRAGQRHRCRPQRRPAPVHHSPGSA